MRSTIRNDCTPIELFAYFVGLGMVTALDPTSRNAR